MYKAALFDLDGTILYTVEDIGAALNYALGTSFPISKVMQFIGRGLRNAVKFALADLGRAATPEDQIDAYTAKLNEYYNAHPVVYTKPYPGVHEFLRELQDKGIRLGVFSNKNQALVDPILSEIFPDISFGLKVGMYGGYDAKPSPQAVFAFCEASGVRIEDVLYFGDSDVDYKTAINAKVDYRILTWGFRTKQQLLEAGIPEEMMIDRIDQTIDLF